MIEHDFFLVDLMKTGEVLQYRKFLEMSKLPNHKITCEQEYYAVDQHDLDSYTRKFCLVHIIVGIHKNQEFVQDMLRKVDRLIAKGFKIILVCPWESEHNLRDYNYHNNHRSAFLKIFKDREYFIWSGRASWFWFHMYEKHKGTTFEEIAEKKYNFLYLNKEPRPHRKKLFERLHPLTNSLVSFLKLDDPIRLPPVYELPWVDQKNYPLRGYDQDIYQKPYQDSFCSIVSESNDGSDEIFITEKVWKAIINKHLFIVHGNHRVLHCLRNYGFKTFVGHIDESYDEIIDQEQKINSLQSIIKSMDYDSLAKAYNDTVQIRNHNFDNFFKVESLVNCINDTVLGFLEFFDSGKIPSRKS